MVVTSSNFKALDLKGDPLSKALKRDMRSHCQRLRIKNKKSDLERTETSNYNLRSSDKILKDRDPKRKKENDRKWNLESIDLKHKLL